MTFHINRNEKTHQRRSPIKPVISAFKYLALGIFNIGASRVSPPLNKPRQPQRNGKCVSPWVDGLVHRMAFNGHRNTVEVFLIRNTSFTKQFTMLTDVMY